MNADDFSGMMGDESAQPKEGWGKPVIPGGLNRSNDPARIDNMLHGSSGWCVPWAMNPDESGRFFLNGNYTLHHGPGGTLCMKVYRDNAGDYLVDVSDVYNKNSQWNAGSLQAGWNVPVAGIKGWSKEARSDFR